MKAMCPCLPHPSQPTNKKVSFADEFLGKVVVQVAKKFLMLEHFSTPGCVINALQLLQALPREVEPRPVDIFIARLPAKRGFFCQGAWGLSSRAS